MLRSPSSPTIAAVSLLALTLTACDRYPPSDGSGGSDGGVGGDTDEVDSGSPCDEVLTYGDADGDGYGDPEDVESSCDPADDRVDNADDCNDADASISPSAEDLEFTRRILEAGDLLGIRLIDHLILGSAGRWVSLKRQGAW